MQRRLGTRSRFSPVWLCVCAQLFAAPGCVLSSDHQRIVAERDDLLVSVRQLEEQKRLLGIANESLDEQNSQLMEEREDILVERDQLRVDLSGAIARETEVGQALQHREEELSVTAAALIAESRKVGRLENVYEGLLGDLEEEVAAGQIRIEQLEDGLALGVSDEILFASGSVDVRPEGRKVLETVARRLRSLDYRISVEGHTDNLAIRGRLRKRYPSNWELAGARAASVVRLFVSAGIDGADLSAVSYGAHFPIGENATSEGRALNRRIEIRLRPKVGAKAPAVNTSSEAPPAKAASLGGDGTSAGGASTQPALQ